MSPRSSTATVELSRPAIVERALEIIDVEGPDAVTIRRIAQSFGVTPMALYWHVANKEELLALVGESFFTGLTPPPRTGTWSQQLRAVVDLIITRLKEHPGAAPLALPRILVCPEGLTLSEHTLRLLREAGFDLNQAADVARTALQTAIMLVTQFPGSESQAAQDERDAIVAEKRRAIAELPGDQFPYLVESAVALTSCDDEDVYYRLGLDMYVFGAEALLRRSKRESRTG